MHLIRPEMKFEFIKNWLSTVLFSIVGIISIVIGISDIFGFEHLLAEKAVPALLLSMIGVIALALGVERTMELRPLHKTLQEVAKTLGDQVSIVGGIKSLMVSDTSRLYSGQDGLYEAVRRTLAGERKDRIIRHAHIQIDPAKGPPSGIQNFQIQQFISQMKNCIDLSGPGSWDVRQFFAVTQVERMEILVQRLQDHQKARAWTVKIWPVNAIFPTFSPLVVGDEDAFLALDDPSSPHVGEGIHLAGNDSVSEISKHFDTFYFAKRLAGSPVFTIRDEQGINETEIANLRKFMSRKDFRDGTSQAGGR